jgi:Mg-chelatase subunit ChlD
MPLDHSEFVVILDRSGSMQEAKNDHIGGLRSFIEDQRKLMGNVCFTLIQFDDANPCEVVLDREPMASIDTGKIDLVPRGGTPLLDAIGLAIARFKTALGDDKPDQVVVMIITDGEENASREFTRDRVKALIGECEKELGWTFLYLGANVDAFDEARGLGIATDFAAGYSPKEVKTSGGLYANVSKKSLKARNAIQASAAPLEAKSAYNFTDKDRDEMTGKPHDE